MGAKPRASVTSKSVVREHRNPDPTKWGVVDAVNPVRCGEADPPFSINDSISALAISTDGSRLAISSSEGATSLWEYPTGRRIRAFRGGGGFSIDALGFSPDGRWLADGFRTIRVHDLHTGSTIHKLGGHKQQVLALAFSPTGNYIATATGTSSVPHDHCARIWDTKTGELLRVFEGHEGQVTGVVWTAAGRHVVTSSADGTMRWWDIRTGKQLRVQAAHDTASDHGVSALAASPDGLALASGGLVDGKVKVWDSNTGENLSTTAIGDDVFRVHFSPDGLRIAAGHHSGTSLWHRNGGTPKRVCAESDVFTFSPDGTRVLMACYDTIWLYDVDF